MKKRVWLHELYGFRWDVKKCDVRSAIETKGYKLIL